MKLTKLQEYWLRCGIPWRLIDATFENFECPTSEQQKARVAMKVLCNREAIFALLYGPSGTGKSHLAAAAMKNVGSGIYATIAELVSLSRCLPFSPEDEIPSKAQLRNTLKDCEVLVLDEIGMTAGNADESALLDELISHRYDRNRTTILISNAHADQLETVFGSRIISRINESCIVIPPMKRDFRETPKQAGAPAPKTCFNGLIPQKPGTSEEERFQKFLLEYDEGAWVGRYNEMRFAPDFIKTAFHEKEKQTTPE